MSGGHERGHGHRHDHGAGGRAGNQRRLALTLALVALYMVAEVVGGLVANSLALLADAGHMLTDVAALGLTMFALWVAGRPATARRSYGFYRAEILVALANGATLVAIAVLIIGEAWRRIAHPQVVQGRLMIAIACGGLAVNLASMLILRGGRDENLAVRGAWLHVLTDALGSLQAIVAGLLITTMGWMWVDPLASVIIALLVLVSSWGLLKESVGVLMESVPGDIDPDRVREAIEAVDGVRATHDLHVWSIGSGFVALSSHVVVDAGCPDDVLWRVRAVLAERFDIRHSTIQIERAPTTEEAGPPLPVAGGGERWELRP